MLETGQVTCPSQEERPACPYSSPTPSSYSETRLLLGKTFLFDQAIREEEPVQEAETGGKFLRHSGEFSIWDAWPPREAGGPHGHLYLHCGLPSPPDRWCVKKMCPFSGMPFLPPVCIYSCPSFLLSLSLLPNFAWMNDITVVGGKQWSHSIAWEAGWRQGAGATGRHASRETSSTTPACLPVPAPVPDARGRHAHLPYSVHRELHDSFHGGNATCWPSNMPNTCQEKGGRQEEGCPEQGGGGRFPQ